MGNLLYSPHCFICRPSDSSVSEDAGIEPRTVLDFGFGSLTLHPHLARSHSHFGKTFIHNSSASSHPYNIALPVRSHTTVYSTIKSKFSLICVSPGFSCTLSPFTAVPCPFSFLNACSQLCLLAVRHHSYLSLFLAKLFFSFFR